MIPIVNIVIACVSSGKELSVSKTCCGTFARRSQSFVTQRASSSVGTSPVSISQNKPSGSGSLPRPVGSFSCNSGILKPLKRIPSCASSNEGSQIILLISRIPPYAWLNVTESITVLPCSFKSALTSVLKAAAFSLNFAFNGSILLRLY